MEISGFELERAREIKEQKGILYEYVHTKTGAKLIFFKTDDKNKLFSVAFKTTPEDDTGVFHILEHSVLCGSKKYPVKKPFVEIMKSSMNTFLNAMTFPDKTLYPVSSRNEKDFFNLAGVYLDAVFSPKIYENPNIFYQEGWHYEMDNADSEPVYNGVVLNEMKGSESNVDKIILNEIMRMLYPDTCYGFVSGGDSQKIPELTYEQFVANHRKYYHPSNSIFYLEGDMDFEKAAGMIAGYLDKYDRGSTAVIDMQKPVPYQEKVCYYDIDDNEDEAEKTRIVYGKISGSFDEKEKNYAIMMLSDILVDSNESPLKKAIIDNGLGKDIQISFVNGIAQPYFQVQIFNTEYEKKDSVAAAVQDTIAGIIRDGIDPEELEAYLNQMEFQLREPNEPKALIHNITVLEAALYGGDPAMYLMYDQVFNSLREKIGTGYYENLLKELFCMDDMQVLYMRPSKTVGEELVRNEKKRLEEAKASWDDSQIQNIINLNKKLKEWQETTDTKEQLDTIPKLELSDIEVLPEERKTTITETGGVQVMLHPSAIDGVVYLRLYFDVPEMDSVKLSYISFISNLFCNLPTSKHEVPELSRMIKKYLGSLNIFLDTSSVSGERDECRLFITVECSVLKRNLDKAVDIIKEVLLDTDFSKTKEEEVLLTQIMEYYRNNIIENGHLYAIKRTTAQFTAEAGTREAIEGYSCYENLRELHKNFDGKKKDFAEFATTFQNNMFVRDKLTISVTAADSASINVENIVNIFRHTGEWEGRPAGFKLKTGNTGIQIPARISYMASGINLYASGDRFSGKWKVMAKIISLAYLWDEVRVKGGAYGTGLLASNTGNLIFYSYRDPNVQNTLSVCGRTADFIRKFCDSGEKIDSFIISSIADTEELLSPKAAGAAADMDEFRKFGYEKQCILRKEMLELNKEELLACADMLERYASEGTVCIAGDQAALDLCDSYNLDIVSI